VRRRRVVMTIIEDTCGWKGRQEKKLDVAIRPGEDKDLIYSFGSGDGRKSSQFEIK